MNPYELSKVLSRIRDMACTARDYHRRGVLCPGLSAWGPAPDTRPDNRSDIYCLGMALSQQLTDADIPPPLQTVLTRTLAHRPQGRYGCCEELIEDLDQILMRTDPFPKASDSS